MAAKKEGIGDVIGRWAFLIGVILAIIFAFATLNKGVIWALVIIGIIVGLLNIAVHEAQTFMLAGAVLVIVAALGGNVVPAGFLANFLRNMLLLFVPATIIVTLKTLWALAKEK
jgi:hypothetical protein